MIYKVMFEFFKTGLFAIGGGLATLPFLNEMSIKYGWFSQDTLVTMIAVSESTPGAIGINMSTYVGNIMFGFWGGMLTTISLVAPSIVIITLIAKVMEKFKNNRYVDSILFGLRIGATALIISAVLNMFITNLFNVDLYSNTKKIIDIFNYRNILLFIFLMFIYNKFNKLHPIFIILLAGFIGILFRF